jgi:hypothetical protein
VATFRDVKFWVEDRSRLFFRLNATEASGGIYPRIAVQDRSDLGRLLGFDFGFRIFNEKHDFAGKAGTENQQQANYLHVR